MIRTFLAIRPSADVLATFDAFAEELRATGGDVRWVRPESIHLTLKFLGDVPEGEISGIAKALEGGFAIQPPIDVEARGLGVFPNLKKPRVLWVGLHGEGLTGLVERAEIALSPIGIPPEDREFVPHLTVGRLRSPRGWEKMLAAVKDARDRSFGVSRIDRAVLYKSDLRPESPVYTPLAEFRFAADESRAAP